MPIGVQGRAQTDPQYASRFSDALSGLVNPLAILEPSDAPLYISALQRMIERKEVDPKEMLWRARNAQGRGLLGRTWGQHWMRGAVSELADQMKWFKDFAGEPLKPGINKFTMGTPGEAGMGTYTMALDTRLDPVAFLNYFLNRQINPTTKARELVNAVGNFGLKGYREDIYPRIAAIQLVRDMLREGRPISPGSHSEFTTNMLLGGANLLAKRVPSMQRMLSDIGITPEMLMEFRRGFK